MDHLTDPVRALREMCGVNPALAITANRSDRLNICFSNANVQMEGKTTYEALG